MRMTNEDPSPTQEPMFGHHRGGVLWLTGLSGAGKSTLATAVHRSLTARGISSYVLDGDRLRMGLNRDLGFSESDRIENVRRVGEIAALFADAGLVAIVALISPYAEAREQARRAAGEQFHEVYIKASVETCAARDPKGLYKRARSGELVQFTGISAPYEIPAQPELTIDNLTHMLFMRISFHQFLKGAHHAENFPRVV
jgi:adenylyl-sulfate kinase